MKTTVCIITMLMLCCTCFIAPAQPAIRFNRLTKEDGLSSDVVYDMLQDRNGFLWIATHGGLDRFDGYHFRHFRHNLDDSNSLSGNYVHCIKEDRNGLIWLTNNNGLNSLDPRTGIIRRFTPSPATMPKDMGDIMIVNDSVLLVAATTTAYVFNIKRHAFTEIKIPVTEKNMYLGQSKFLKDAKGNICLSTEFIRVDWQHYRLQYLPVNKETIPAGTGLRITEYDSRGNAWHFFSGKQLLQTKDISGKQVNYPFINEDPGGGENTICDFFEDGNKMWICTDAGLVYYDYGQNQFYRYRQEPGNGASLSNNRVRCMIKDKNGLYWVGTFGGGVCYFNDNTRFKNIIIDKKYNDEDRKVYGLKALYSGRIIVHTMAGKGFMLEKDKSLHELDYAKDFKTPASLEDLVNEFTGRSLQENSTADFTALRNYFGASKISYRHTFKYIVTASWLKSAMTKGTILPYNEKIWINYPNRLYDGKTDHYYKQDANYILPIANNHFLFATNNGLVEFDANKDSTIHTWLPQPGNPYSIGGTWISCIVQDGKGNYWIGTADAGFDYWDVRQNRFYHYTTKDGLPDNKIYTILPDKQGRLWMSTDNGLSCFDTLKRSFTNYSKEDGLINTEYNSGSACVDIDGQFYFGGMDGIDYFNPDSIDEERPVPVLQLASFLIYNKERLLKQRYELATNDNNIQLEFTANDFANAAKLLFQYKLTGVDESWVNMQGNNIALYSKLPPGKYKFEVKGSYDGKKWSRPLVVDFRIATPWFEAKWFYILLALALTGGIYVFFDYRMQQQLKLYSMRNRISRDLHDDVGATLSSVKAYSKILKDNPDNPVIADLIEENAVEMIERLEVITWATNPHHDSFQSLYNRIQRYAAPLCLANKIDFEFTTDGVAKEMMVPGEIRENIFLVAKEAVNNSLKYADPKKLNIGSTIQSGKFMLHITDDGKGFDVPEDDDGNGLKNMHTRIQDIGGNIIITSEQGRGTQITIQLAYPFRYPKLPKQGGGDRLTGF